MCLFSDSKLDKLHKQRMDEINGLRQTETDTDIELSECRGYCLGRTNQGVSCHAKTLNSLLCSEHSSQRKGLLEQLRNERWSIRLWGYKKNFVLLV